MVEHPAVIPTSRDASSKIMGFWVYILYSDSGNKYYVGQSDNPERRLSYHNSSKKGFTSRYRPWRLVYSKEYTTREMAKQSESKIKRWKSKKMIEKLIEGKINLENEIH